MNRRIRLIVHSVTLAGLTAGSATTATAQATVTVLDTMGSVGYHPAIAIGSDGLGLIVYQDASVGGLKVAHCQDAACTSATLSRIGSAGSLTRETAIAIGADGLAIISYHDETLRVLKAAHCDDVACTSATVTVVDPTRVLGRTSIAIGSDGLPLITYVRGDEMDARLASAHCSNVACSASTTSVLRSVAAGNGGLDTAVAIGADGLALIAYIGQFGSPGPGYSIAMAHCVDVPCTAVTPPGPVPPTADARLVGFTFLYGPSLFIGPDGRGLVSYHRAFVAFPVEHTSEVVAQHCATVTCGAFDSTRLFPVPPNDALKAPIATGTGGLPRLARAQNQKLRLTQCADAACSSSTDSCVLVSGRDTAMATGTDGLPLVGLLTFPGEDLAVVHGSDPCLPSSAAIQDLTMDEGDGQSSRIVQVTLNTPTDETATVHLETADVTAQAGSDYEAVSATLTFQPGQARQDVQVTLLGDTQQELDETFELVLSDPQGLTIGDGSGIVTLRNDDATPTVSVQDCSVTEGDSGDVGCQLEARLSAASGLPVSVDFATASGTAQAGVDFLPAAGTLSFAPGTTTQPVTVSVVGDVDVELDEAFFVDLSNPVNVVIAGEGEGLIVDDDAPSLSSLELTHGARVRADLAALPGPIADQDLYRLAQGPYSSWEVVVDEVSGDAAPGLLLERLAEDNSTVLQAAAAPGTGPARALRWQRRAATAEVRQHLRVSSASCTTGCGTDDTYRLRAYETTGTIPRFNDYGTQVTVLILQNATADPIQANADFWDADGTLLATIAIALGPHVTSVTDTSSIPGLQAQRGSITVTHDGPYGGLVGKAVALEPQTGFSFDSPMESKPR